MRACVNHGVCVCVCVCVCVLGVAFIATLFSWWLIPETNGRSLEQLEAELAQLRLCGPPPPPPPAPPAAATAAPSMANGRAEGCSGPMPH